MESEIEQEAGPTEPYLYHEPRSLADRPGATGQIPKREEQAREAYSCYANEEHELHNHAS